MVTHQQVVQLELQQLRDAYLLLDDVLREVTRRGGDNLVDHPAASAARQAFERHHLRLTNLVAI